MADFRWRIADFRWQMTGLGFQIADGRFQDKTQILGVGTRPRINNNRRHRHAENVQAERLNGILKDKYLLDQVFQSTRQARKATRGAIHLYNEDRPHMSLEYDTPSRVYRAA